MNPVILFLPRAGTRVLNQGGDNVHLSNRPRKPENHRQQRIVPSDDYAQATRHRRLLQNSDLFPCFRAPWLWHEIRWMEQISMGRI